MKARSFALLCGVIVAVFAAASEPTAGQRAPAAKASPNAKTAWVAPRMPWGDPDIAGIFTTDDELGVPFERPEQFAGRELVTEEEFAQRLTQAERQAEADSEEFIAPRAGNAPEGAGGTGPPNHWLEHGKPSRTSRRPASTTVAPEHRCT